VWWLFGKPSGYGLPLLAPLRIPYLVTSDGHEQLMNDVNPTELQDLQNRQSKNVRRDTRALAKGPATPSEPNFDHDGTVVTGHTNKTTHYFVKKKDDPTDLDLLKELSDVAKAEYLFAKDNPGSDEDELVDLTKEYKVAMRNYRVALKDKVAARKEI